MGNILEALSSDNRTYNDEPVTRNKRGKGGRIVGSSAHQFSEEL